MGHKLSLQILWTATGKDDLFSKNDGRDGIESHENQLDNQSSIRKNIK